MHSAGPTPSLAALFASWWALSGSIFSACFRRFSAFTENCDENTLVDALTDVGCPTPRADDAEGTPPPLDSWEFADELLDDAHAALRRVALILDEDPHSLTEDATRDRIRAVFDELAELAIDHAHEMRLARILGPSSRPESLGWDLRYRKMLAEEGKWPTNEESSVGVLDGPESER